MAGHFFFGSKPGGTSPLSGWLKLMLSSKIRLRVYLAVMVIALVLTRSRMGNIAFFTSLALAGGVAVLLLVLQAFQITRYLV